MDSNLSLDFYLAIYTFTSVADRPNDRPRQLVHHPQMEGRQPLWQLAQPNGHGKKETKKVWCLSNQFLSLLFVFSCAALCFTFKYFFGAILDLLHVDGTSQIVTDSLKFYQVYKIGIGNNNNDHRSVISIFLTTNFFLPTKTPEEFFFSIFHAVNHWKILSGEWSFGDSVCRRLSWRTCVCAIRSVSTVNSIIDRFVLGPSCFLRTFWHTHASAQPSVCHSIACFRGVRLANAL